LRFDRGGRGFVAEAFHAAPFVDLFPPRTKIALPISAKTES
jgi:hypothetical protein